jgi:ABC-2 type transport system permease protein
MDDGLLLLLRFAFVWIGIYLGLTFYPNPEGVTAVRTVEFPIGFLGNPFVAIFTMPAWLGAIALWNPLSSTVSAARQLFGDPIGAHPSWIELSAPTVRPVLQQAPDPGKPGERLSRRFSEPK